MGKMRKALATLTLMGMLLAVPIALPAQSAEAHDSSYCGHDIGEYYGWEYSVFVDWYDGTDFNHHHIYQHKQGYGWDTHQVNKICPAGYH